MWSRIGALAEPSGYEMFGVLAFLEQVPDRDRAAAGVRAGRAAAVLPPGSSRSTPRRPVEYFLRHSPSRRCPARSPAPAVRRGPPIEVHLDHLAGAQGDDGGWTFNWPSWSPAAEADWRGFLTVNALRVLRANGRA